MRLLILIFKAFLHETLKRALPWFVDFYDKYRNLAMEIVQGLSSSGMFTVLGRKKDNLLHIMGLTILDGSFVTLL